MFISGVDQALRGFLQSQVSSGGGPVDVVFDAPTPEWAAQLSRPTVCLFLHYVERSSQTARAPQRRFDANGRPERRSATQLLELGYVVTVWAPDAATEHQVLGRVASVLVGNQNVPTQHVPDSVTSPVSLGFGGGETPRPPAPFTAAGPMKAYALLAVTVASDAVEQEERATVRPVPRYEPSS